MNFLALIPGLIIGVGVVLIIRELVPKQPQLSAALNRVTDTTELRPVVEHESLQHRVGSWLERNLPDRSWLRAPATDLSLIGMSTEKYYYDKMLLALTGLLAPAALGLFAQALGFLPFYIPAALGIPIAAWLWASVDQDVRKKADVARHEFQRAVAVYLELVGAELKRGATAALALRTAAGVGKSWVFMRIRQDLNEARHAGTTEWDSLNQLSIRIDVPELGGLAKIVRLSGEKEASIYETLRSSGKALRNKLLAEEHEQANSASERMQMPLATTVLVYVGIIITPLMLRMLIV